MYGIAVYVHHKCIIYFTNKVFHVTFLGISLNQNNYFRTLSFCQYDEIMYFLTFFYFSCIIQDILFLRLLWDPETEGTLSSDPEQYYRYTKK